LDLSNLESAPRRCPPIDVDRLMEEQVRAAGCQVGHLCRRSGVVRGRLIRPLIDRVYLDIDSGLIGGIDRRRRLRSSSSTSTPSLRFPRLPSEQEDDDECNDKGCPEDELWIREEASRRMRLAVLPHVD